MCVGGQSKKWGTFHHCRMFSLPSWNVHAQKEESASHPTSPFVFGKGSATSDSDQKVKLQSGGFANTLWGSNHNFGHKLHIKSKDFIKRPWRSKGWFWFKTEHQIRRLDQQTLRATKKVVDRKGDIKSESSTSRLEGSVCNFGQQLHTNSRELRRLHYQTLRVPNLFDFWVESSEGFANRLWSPCVFSAKTSTWDREISPAEPEGPNIIWVKKSISNPGASRADSEGPITASVEKSIRSPKTSQREPEHSHLISFKSHIFQRVDWQTSRVPAWFWSQHRHQPRRAHKQTLKVQTWLWSKS